jgi:hypothetical protein
MEKQSPSQNLSVNPQTAPEQTPPPVPHHEHSKKKLILAILGVVLLLAVFSGAFYYLGASRNVASQNQNETTNQTSNSPTPTQEVNNSSGTRKNLVPITENTVSYGYQGNKLLMNYKDKVYSYDTSGENPPNEPKPESSYPNVTWYGLIDAPLATVETLKKQPHAYDEIFSFAPQRNGNFVFAMRWDRLIGDNKYATDLPLYYFDTKNQTLEKLASFTASDKEYSFPIFNSASPDNKNLAFGMYGCWNCGGHYPQIRLINIDTKATKNLGQVLEFKWTGNNTYSYKEYREIECKEPQPGPCLEDAKNLPLKTGTF